MATDRTKVLVTGAEGFIGKNLCLVLSRDRSIQLFRYDLDKDKHTFNEYLSKANFIFHLAGVNRPNHEEDFDENIEITDWMVSRLEEKGLSTPIAFSSTIQAELDNPYGESKRKAEQILFAFSKRSGCPVYIYRLHNVFGKWSRPNYNSVVATFCFNTARGISLNVVDENKTIEFLYVDDIVQEFASLIYRSEYESTEGYLTIDKRFKITVGQLFKTIRSFKEISKNKVIPDLSDNLTRYLYSTYLSYLPEESLDEPVIVKEDKRGILFELIKSPKAGQIFISKTRTGVTRGNHYHDTKVEKFCVIQGTASIKLRNLQNAHILTYAVSGENVKVLNIPPGYIHEITNTGDEELITLFWASEIFDPEAPDTYYEEV